uniref:Tf2-1-like SH3-like domain-containing protein n=1 Tax=Ananas comosus var. bracteatus TaxID=296719 RepID=A0A6V7NEQ8_ANACO|nr:unnamed protein product [Ananas comosus var. bracteatus]
MAPFEALYGRKCRSPLHWSEVGERLALGPDVLQEAEDKVRIARERLLTAQSRQRSYADRRRRDLEFQIGDHVFLKVSPTKGIRRFGIRGKLSPRYIGPYEILERVARWRIDLLYRRTYRVYTMYSMYRSFGSTSTTRLMCWTLHLWSHGRI